MALKDNIRRLRINQGLTQAHLAKKIKVSTVSMNLYESGKKNPSPARLLAISQALNCRVEDLTGQAIKAPKKEIQASGGIEQLRLENEALRMEVEFWKNKCIELTRRVE